jgi:C-terminal processing protease CtpA/Prc
LGILGAIPQWPVTDGDIMYVRESGCASTKGEWGIEGHGIDPDVDVQNDLKPMLKGRKQLEPAVAELMKKLRANPVKLPPKPARPIKTREKNSGLKDRRQSLATGLLAPSFSRQFREQSWHSRKTLPASENG